jgi:glycosyltransferase involved in cell wall biosynthesis
MTNQSTSHWSVMITCVVPARNEAGRLTSLVAEISTIQEITEIILAEGGSSDDTWQVAKELHEKFPHIVKCVKQSGKGKFNAVLEASAVANNDWIIIWDADGTVPAESNQRLIELAKNQNSLVMGNRLTGSREYQSIRFFNLLGNWIFAILWKPLIQGRRVDLFCGSKVFPKKLIDSIDPELMDMDSYGDLTIIMQAKKVGYPIISEPVQYLARTYGETNMLRWSVGKQFLILTLIAYRKSLSRSR